MKTEPFGHVVKDYEYWCDMFLTEKKSSGVSENTFKLYTRILEEFGETLREYQEDINFSDIGRLVINMHLRRLRDKGLSSSTIKTHLIILKSFFSYVSEHNEDLIDFTKALNKIEVKVDKKEHVVLTQEEVERFISVVEMEFDIKNTLKSCRDSLILKILIETGMRSSSLLGLKFSDIEKVTYDGKEFYKLRIRQKGNKENVLYIVADVIDREMEFCRRKKNGEDFVAFSKQGRMSRKQLYNLVQKYLRLAGINKSGVHILRHTFVHLKRLQGVDLSTIQSMLGHSSITTTINVYGTAKEMDKILAASKSVVKKDK